MTKHKKTFWKYLSDNVTKGRISTILGVLIVIGAIVSVFIDKADWSQACLAIAAGFAAIGFIGKNKDGESNGSNSL
ncbi:MULTISPECIES: hypothetical protein [Leptospira]|uniref:Uncharacterized protein n=1 Tax=Leptospira interrogans str. UI 12758 TaxID=1049938 RepID=A0A0E2DAM4_LEPIR|nr:MULTISPECIES: hypothetical protein [Leptospira]AJR16680.1 hypothetical protein LIL_50014 [Leptospira interrogans serovar Linhai str. 56609]EKR57170.1 hypothetical protein LEP1GSC105_0114 [Leptospira interrogans str. UI 12758]EKR82612.1 hypothetical protein LEP1GSC099_1483 [Leptospira interrogans str. UI 08452]EMJ55956.1 hypothetical protein LEP1GSC111_4202 [Leptospira interrogans str. UT126]EMN33227.1 hypothetical protein LEP1GSC084_1110 [Leptospira interrogans serovar Medanensis str. L0448